MKKVLTSLAGFPLFLISLIPFSLLYAISDLLFIILFYLSKYRRRVVWINLTNSFPEKDEKELRLVEKKFYRYLSDMIVETIKMASMSERSVRKHFKIKNPEVIGDYFKAGRSVMLVTAHYGNWEWGSLALSSFFSEPFIIVYKPITNTTFERMMNYARSRFGAVMVAMKKTLRKIVSYRSETFCAVFLGDQTPVRSESHYFTPFLNQQTPVFLGIEKIARMTGSAVVFGHIDRVKRGFYEATFTSLTDHPNDLEEFKITETHTQMLEKIIKEKPELWLWSHKRWKNSNYKYNK